MQITNDLMLAKLLDVFYVRKGLMAAVFVVVFCLAAYLAVSLPSVYQSGTLIMVSPPKLPANYVQSPVQRTVDERIRTITEQILSRTSLEKTVKELSLYPAGGPGVTMEDRVERLRKNIQITSGQNNRRRGGGSEDTFRLSFEADSPEKAMQVAARLASLFIEENLQSREQLAMGTTNFIDAETQRLRKELEEQEEVVNKYKAQARYELPEQLDANLRTLEQLRTELQNNSLRLQSQQERKATLEKQLAEGGTTLVDLAGGPGAGLPQTRSRSEQLATLLSQYSEKHPDVIRLKQEIQALEGDDASKTTEESDAPPVARGFNRVRQTLQNQIGELRLEIQSLQSKNEILRRQISSYQARVDNTPLRAIELTKISRSYDITLKKYQDLMGKRLESQLSENMEKKQKGEQFYIVDPANFPQKPVRPNRPLILLAGFFGALFGGFGLAFALENMQLSFKRPDEFEGYIDVPLLATLPAIVTRGSILEHRRAQGMLIFASLAVLTVGVVCIRIFGPQFF